MLQVGRKLRSRQASQVAEEDWPVDGPRQPAHGLQQDLGVGRNVLSEGHESLGAPFCAVGQEDTNGRNVGRGQHGEHYEWDGASDGHGGHPPIRGVGVEVHSWSDGEDSKAKYNDGDDAEQANEDCTRRAGLVDIEEVEGGDH